MTIGEWTALAAIVVSVIGVLVTFLGWASTRRVFAEQSGADRQRLNALEAWKQNDSIDRSEYDGHEKRLVDLEAAMRDMSDLKLDLAVHRAEFKGFRELAARDSEELKHGQRNTKLALDKLTDLVTQARAFGPPPKTSRRTAEDA